VVCWFWFGVCWFCIRAKRNNFSVTTEMPAAVLFDLFATDNFVVLFSFYPFTAPTFSFFYTMSLVAGYLDPSDMLTELGLTQCTLS
jgi:hypothetical protein